MTDCLICGIEIGLSKCSKPRKAGLITLKEKMQLRVQLKDEKYINHRVLIESVENLLQSNVIYHRLCYQDVTNIKKIGTRNATASSTNINTSKFDNKLCIFCQSTTSNLVNLHNVTTESMSEKIKFFCEKYPTDENLKKVSGLFLNTSNQLLDIASSLKYHKLCLTDFERKDVLETRTSECTVDISFADKEILRVLQNKLNDPDAEVDMNTAVASYKIILEKCNLTYTEAYLKIHLKKLIEDNIPSIQFIKPKQKTLPEKLMKSVHVTNAIFADKRLTDEQILQKAANILRKIVNERHPEKYNTILEISRKISSVLEVDLEKAELWVMKWLK
jgi:hypothetical protein